MEPGERIDGNPAVLIRRIGHQTQCLPPPSRIDRPGSRTFYRGEANDELFDEIPFQLFERNDVVFIFEESGKTPATQTVILIGGISAILTFRAGNG